LVPRVETEQWTYPLIQRRERLFTIYKKEKWRIFGMGRPIKEGLDYFPLDVGFFNDPKILMTEEEFGPKGGYIAIRLLCLIYQEGYCVRWNNKMALALAKGVGDGVTGALVGEVVNALIRNEFFDEGLYNRCAILTSTGIQKRWSEITRLLKRKAEIHLDHKLDFEESGISSENTAVNSEEKPPNKEGSTLKEREGKGKRKEIIPPPTREEGKIENPLPGPSELFVQVFPQRYLLVAKNHGVPHEEIPAELKKFDEWHVETNFQNAAHAISGWGIWCSKYKEKHEKPKISNGSNKQQQTVTAKKPTSKTMSDWV
jgi:hypothetical protein